MGAEMHFPRSEEMVPRASVLTTAAKHPRRARAAALAQAADFRQV